MRPHIRTLIHPIVAAAAALALLAAGCGGEPADPAPLAAATTDPAELPLTEPEPADPAPRSQPDPGSDLEPARLLESAAEPASEPEEAATPEAQVERPEAATTHTDSAPTVDPEPVPEGEPQPASGPELEPEPDPEPELEPDPEPELAPCPEGEHRHGNEPCHHDDPEPEPVQAEAPPENAVVEVEDEPDSDEVHPHAEDTIPDRQPGSGVFPSARGEQPTVSWQVHVSGIVEGARPLPMFTAAVQAWSDWCFFDWVARSVNKTETRQQCAIALSLIGMATELMGVTDECATRQYRGQLEMMRGEGEFDFAADFGRVGWHACPSVIDPDPSDDIPSPYFDAAVYAASLMPDDDCTRASWAAEVYLQQLGIWMAEWRC